MRLISADRLATVFAALPGIPRVVAGGNFATPWRALALLDSGSAPDAPDAHCRASGPGKKGPWSVPSYRQDH
jgi:hypothetical protein